MRAIREQLSSRNLLRRVLFSTLFFLVLFFGIMIISHLILPEGVLKNKNPLQNWETSNNTYVLTLQIFLYNMLSVLVISFGSLFGQKKESEAQYLSIGYLAFFAQICINGVVLGTWSFSMGGEAVPLLNRITRTFDLVHRAGLWEMMGQLLITCALAHIATILTSGKTTVTRKFREIHLTRSESIVLITGFALMLTGAIIESLAIHSL
ncbi:hypothetical protein [Gorillibacterium timonense]|uniref:hypothetical protein n=1 Tax=Gorillibacterium timonense TaxID=1689269 RepID=UPI00071CC0B8|nr:hypothetical protein [Gorillibacterium timonense]